MHFCVHFPKENVQQRTAEHFFLENVRQNRFDAKIDLMQKCFFAKQSITFCRCVTKMHLMQKCIFATHQQNVRAPLSNILVCKNAFDALQKSIFASHFVGAKMHLMPKCILAVQKCI